MRRFFNFRSSSSSSNEKGEESKDARAPKDSARRPPKCYADEDSSGPQLTRSLSFSAGSGERNSSSDQSGSPASYGNSHHRGTECVQDFPCSTPDRYRRTGRGNRSARHLNEVDMLDSPSLSSGYQCSSGNSPPSSPVPIRCRSARLTKILDKNQTLDLYIDGEQQEAKVRKESRRHSSLAGIDGYLAANVVLPSTGRPPRAQSTAPSSPTYSYGNARTHSMREVKDNSHHICAQDWTRSDMWPASPQRHTTKNIDKLLNALPEKIMTSSRDNDSEISATTEDIYEDSSNAHPTSNVIQHYDDTNDCSGEGTLRGQMPASLEREPLYWKNDNLVSSEPHEHNADEELNKRQKELERMYILLAEEDLEMNDLHNNSYSGPTMLQTIRNLMEDRRQLVHELSSQIKCRIADRSSANARLKQAKLEVDIRTRRLEKEKNELQSSLEKELDRRSSSWSLKLEKFQSEEQRLRERVRELAEQNVSLQREISLIKGNEVENRSRIMSSEMQLNDLTTSLKEAKIENQDLHQAFSEIQERFKEAEEVHDSIRLSLKEKEKENKELQKVIVRLQRVCGEQEKTINGLRQGYSNEIGKAFAEGSDNLNRLRMEQLRLTGVEQLLRKEVESCRNETESFRHENMCLLDRLRATSNGFGFSSSKLDRELHARVDCMESQGLSLLEDNAHFCRELLGLVKRKSFDREEANADFDGYPIAECTVKYQSLRRKAENYRRSLQTVVSILDEKKNSETLECQSHAAEDKLSQSSKCQGFEDAMEHELKAETLLTSLLREKLYSKEVELEQLQEDLASSLRAHDVLQTETQRLKDEVSSLTHKTKDMELHMMRKDESINQLHHDLQERTKELTATRSILTKVTQERDRMWEQVKHSSETIMLLNHEGSSLKKRIEALDEDVLVKEGQIAILKDSLGDKPFDIICSPKSVEEFDREY